MTMRGVVRLEMVSDGGNGMSLGLVMDNDAAVIIDDVAIEWRRIGARELDLGALGWFGSESRRF